MLPLSLAGAGLQTGRETAAERGAAHSLYALRPASHPSIAFFRAVPHR